MIRKKIGTAFFVEGNKQWLNGFYDEQEIYLRAALGINETLEEELLRTAPEIWEKAPEVT